MVILGRVGPIWRRYCFSTFNNLANQAVLLRKGNPSDPPESGTL